jgi:hypothetical protein
MSRTANRKQKTKVILVDTQTYQEDQDAFELLHLLKIAEKAIQNGNFESSEKVFSDLRKKILENGINNN